MLGEFARLPRLEQGVHDHFAILREALVNLSVDWIGDNDFIEHIIFKGDGPEFQGLSFSAQRHSWQPVRSFERFAQRTT